MRKFIATFCLAFILLPALLSQIGCSRGNATASAGPDISNAYLAQARLYRDEGRYDLARQSYAQALATCRSNANLAIIEHELAGCELLIRTMR